MAKKADPRSPDPVAPGPGPSDPDERPFEAVFAELEEVVSQLESGELPLEESLARFEVGLGDYRRCIAILDGVEKRIEMLDDQARGGTKPLPGFESGGAGDADGQSGGVRSRG